MGSQWSQFFPPKPNFSSSDLAPLDSKVFIVTGGASGIGLELCKVLYQKNGIVYIAGRSEENAKKAMRDIRATASSANGHLEFLLLNLMI